MRSQGKPFKGPRVAKWFTRVEGGLLREEKRGSRSVPTQRDNHARSGRQTVTPCMLRREAPEANPAHAP